ncbi:MBL fold metallo-hydrolase [Aquiflexum sp. LQ15W]|uniref:MBL fold metallo-hydrolase n=1 Tax=Cognataquiflexum nitidum TaxID=2922272 RepID=UPI001F12CB37|nr:MBL fold metallo-hydrolase [Cognataquiflexum nitidum]MCH6198211.1 MBL fold metallo-hydrolase [Cognataquiflexum nitidum]
MKNKSYLYILLVPVIFFLMKNGDENKTTLKFTSNPELVTIQPDQDWKGNPLDEKGRFVNLYHPFESNLGDLLKWQMSKNPQKEEKKSEIRRLPVDFDSIVFDGQEDYLIWLGHATYLMRIHGKVFLTDPLLIDNTFLKRESSLPFPLEKMPKLDYILLSHNHRDHCDENSIKYIAKVNPSLKILTGLGLESLINGWTNGHTIQEAGWYQQYSLLDSGVTITYVPSRHWSKRWLTDDNKSLWGGFYIQNGNYSIYFMGDSGKGPHFADIKKTLGTPDYCLMGVGAYKPEWFMHQAHISPKDAIDAFNTLEGKFFIPMHFGTFNLSDEPRMEPWDILESNQKKIKGKLIEPLIGKNLLIDL